MATNSLGVRIEEVAVQDALVRFTYRLYAKNSEHPALPAKQEVYEAFIKLPTEGLRATLSTSLAAHNLRRQKLDGRTGAFGIRVSIRTVL